MEKEKVQLKAHLKLDMSAFRKKLEEILHSTRPPIDVFTGFVWPDPSLTSWAVAPYSP